MNPKNNKAVELTQNLSDEEMGELIPGLIKLISEIKQRRQGIAGSHSTKTPEQLPRSLLELHGLGKGVWEDLDLDKYVKDLRNEWGHR